jgi:hypothetical protein
MAIDYATISNTTGTYPNVTANNVTAPGAGDGTPYTKAVIDDLWGFAQAVLTYGGATPTGVAESATNSQRLDAIVNSLSPPGTVVGWHGSTNPLVFGARLIELQGQGVLRTSYPDLDTACYVGNSLNGTAEAYYRADDSAGTSRNTSGIYLILPDARGVALRGYDPSEIYDPDGSTRIFPDTQTHSMEQHRHNVLAGGSAVLVANEVTNKNGGSASSFDFITWNFVGPAAVFAEDVVVGSANTNNFETRMVNLQVKWCVRY